jgi:hypothetical protein
MHAQMAHLDAWYPGCSTICWLAPLVPEVLVGLAEQEGDLREDFKGPQFWWS